MLKKKQTTRTTKVTKKKKVAKKKAAVKKKPKHNKIKSSEKQKAQIKEIKSTVKKTKAKKTIRKVANKIGRPSILTDELVKKVSSLILAGAYIETACAAVGFSKKLYFEWLKLAANLRQLLVNEEEETDIEELKTIRKKIAMIDPIYLQFSDSIQKAVVESELRDLMRIDAAAVKSWQAAAWKLERKHPQRWSRNQKIEHTGEVKQNVAVEVSIDDTRRTILDMMKNPEALLLAEKLVDQMTIEVSEDD